MKINQKNEFLDLKKAIISCLKLVEYQLLIKPNLRIKQIFLHFYASDYYI